MVGEGYRHGGSSSPVVVSPCRALVARFVSCLHADKIRIRSPIRAALAKTTETNLQSSSGARLGTRKVVRAEKDGGNDEVSAGRAVGNVVHAGALTLALVHDARNLMTSLRLLVARLGTCRTLGVRPWQ